MSETRTCLNEKRVDEMLRPLLLLLALLTAVLNVADPASADPGVDLSGTYACQGINPDGSSYESVVVEIVRYNDAYQLRWLADSDLIAVGMGIRTGDVLAVSYLSGLPGVVAYRIEEGDRLVGEWTVAGAEGELFSETLVKVSSTAAAPSRREKKTPIANTREL